MIRGFVLIIFPLTASKRAGAHFQLPRSRGKDRHGDKYLARVFVVVLAHEMLSRSSLTADVSRPRFEL